MARYFVFAFDGTNVSARARLDEKLAPQTCRVLWERLPYKEPCRHGIYSGTTTAILIDPTIVIPPENGTVLVQKRDLMFTHYEPNVRHGHPEPVSEIYWAYDRYCSPRMPGALLPTVPNVFGEFLSDYEAFFEACAKIRFDGPRPLTVTGETE
jgi:hypothetical protein